MRRGTPPRPWSATLDLAQRFGVPAVRFLDSEPVDEWWPPPHHGDRSRTAARAWVTEARRGL